MFRLVFIGEVCSLTENDEIDKIASWAERRKLKSDSDFHVVFYGLENLTETMLYSALRHTNAKWTNLLALAIIRNAVKTSIRCRLALI